MKWNKGQPPKDHKRRLFKYASGIICSGSYGIGRSYEPQPEVRTWRCDCCGKFADPVAWRELK